MLGIAEHDDRRARPREDRVVRVESAHRAAVLQERLAVTRLRHAEAARVRHGRSVGEPPRRRQDLVRPRLEEPALGEREVPNHAYYGVQTVRAIENFPFSGIHVGHYEHFVRALACVKKACAKTNAELGVLDAKIAGAIEKACDEIIAGKLHDQFRVDMIQGGAGTSTNMCANEVIANRALELLGHAKGDYAHCHPNDHVNCSQSTNDAYPTAIKLGGPQVAMAIETGESDQLDPFCSRASVIRRSGDDGRGRHAAEERHDRCKGRLHPHRLYAKGKDVRPGSSAG